MRPRSALSGACLVVAAVVSGCFVDALGVATDGGEGGSSAATPATTNANGTGGSPNVSSSTDSMGGAGGQGGTGGGAVVLAQECDDDEVGVDIDDGTLVCAPIGPMVRAAIDGGCTVQLGWSDICGSGCSSAPAKYGRTGLSSCDESGNDNDCGVHDLGGVQVRLLGINLDGAVGEDDRWYAGFICEPGNEDVIGCGGSDALLAGASGMEPICTSASRALYAPLRACSFVFGWKDNCNGGCVDPPQKIGAASTAECKMGTGTGNVCVASPYDPASSLFTLDTDGIVNDDDRFFFGLTCGAVTPESSTSTGTCPSGQFVTGIYSDGSLRCRTVGELSAAHFREQCSLYSGWRTGCNGCDDPPTQWGRVRVGACTAGAVTDDACATVSFDGDNVSMFGLSPDENVDGDDKLFVGLSCQ